MADLDRLIDKERLAKISRVLNEIEIENKKHDMIKDGFSRAIDEFPTEEIIKDIEETLENEL
jgi:ribosomal protein L16/L10AE